MLQLLARRLAHRGPHRADVTATARRGGAAALLEEGRDPDNNVRPEDLSPFERSHLKDAFQIVSNAQKFLRFRYNAGGATRNV